MKKYLLLILSLLCAVGAFAQDRGSFDAFAATLASKEVSFRYSFEVQGDVPMKGNGTASLCGASYRVSGNGMECWCDGVTRWSVDRSAKEAYIEAVDPTLVDYLSNPAALLGALESAFRIDSVAEAKRGGRALQALHLVPSVDGTGLDAVVLYLDSSTPVEVSIAVSDGPRTLFRLSDYSVKEKSDAAYSFDIASLGADFAVTDLR